MFEEDYADLREQMLEAFQLLVDHSISRIASDKTIVCTITDNSEREKGHYKVTQDGSVIYDAYSEKTTYILGEQVLVQQYADPNVARTIMSRYINESGAAQAVNYVSSKDKIIGESSMTWTHSAMEQIFANGNNKMALPSVQTININGLAPNTPIENSALYNTIYIRAKFECNIPEDTMRSGSYGLRVRFSTVNAPEVFHDYYLDSSMMFGNPYKYIVPFEQEILYNYEDLPGDLTFQSCELYQRGDFQFLNDEQKLEDISRGELPGFDTSDSSQWIGPAISVSDIEIIIGTDVESAKDKTILVKNLSGKNEYDGAESKRFSMLWFNKTEDNKYIGFEEESEFSPKARWQRGTYIIEKIPDKDPLYHIKDVDGRRYETTEQSSLASDTPVYYLLNEEGKAEFQGKIQASDKDLIHYNILWYATNRKGQMQLLDSYTNSKTAIVECVKTLRSTSVRCELWRNGIKYTHEAIVLQNKAAIAKEDFAITNLEVEIQHKTDSKSVYAIYSGATNSLINSHEAWKKREVTFAWSSEDNVIDPSFWRNAQIQWSVSGAMLFATEEAQAKKEIAYKNGSLANNTFEYSISEFFIANSQDNKISCTISQVVNGGTVTFKAEMPIQFAISGASGTDYTIIFTPEAKKITFSVVDGDNNIITPAKMQYKIFHGNKASIWQDGNSINTTGWIKENYNLIEVRAQVDHAGTKVWVSNYYQDWNVENDYYAVAPSSIIYDNTGANPTYYKGDWKVYNKKTNELVDPITYEWNIRYYGDQDIYLPAAASKDLWGDPYRDFEMEADVEYNKDYDRIIVTSAAQGLSDLFPEVQSLKIATGHPTQGYAWIEIVATGGAKTQITADKLITGNCYLVESEGETKYEFDLEKCKGFKVLDKLAGNKALIIQRESSKLEFKFFDNTGNTISPETPIRIQELITTHNEKNIFDYTFDETVSCKQYIIKYIVPSAYNEAYLTYKLDESGEPTGQKLPTDKAFLIELASKNTYLYPVSNNILPVITDNHEFKVPSLYTESGAYAAIEVIRNKEVLINVPIYISLLQHESQLLNDWDGALVVDNDKGIALAAMLGAGRKNDDNTFSGVVMGERHKLEEMHGRNDIGIFGFNHGIQSYEFNVDGTARLGAPGRGQIVFDGNQGLIASANWFNEAGNLRQELDAGSGLKIDIQQGTLYAKANEQNILTFDGNGLTIKGTINGGLICSTNWKGEKDPGTGAIRETSEGTAFDLVNGFLSTAGITIGSINGEDDNATLSMLTIDSSDGIRGTGNIYLQTPDYRHQISSTTETKTLAFAYTSARTTRNTNGRLNIRKGPGNSHGVITSYDFKKGDTFYFKNKKNEAIDDPEKLKKWREYLATNNNWLPILLYKEGSKVYPHKNDNVPTKDSFVGYIYYKGAETSILFDSPDACENNQKATITITNIGGSGIELTDKQSKIMIAKKPTELTTDGSGVKTPATYMMIGDTTSDYALEIGTLKIAWDGTLIMVDTATKRKLVIGVTSTEKQSDTYAKYAVQQTNENGSLEKFWNWTDS